MATLTIVTTVAVLQTTAGSTSINVFVTDPNQGGYFYYSATNPYASFETSGPDLGIVFSANGTGFWVRKMDESGAINVKWFGAIGDQSTDDTTAINKAASFVTLLAKNNLTTNISQTTSVKLYFPVNHTYKVLSTITVGPGVSIQMDSSLYLADSTNTLPCLVIGDNSVPANTGLEFKIKVFKFSVSDWSNTNCIGVQFVNPAGYSINIQYVYGFTIGVQFLASTTPSNAAGSILYNTTTLGSIQNNQIGLDLTKTGLGSFINENIFLNGNFTVDGSVTNGLSRYGIRFNYLDHAYDHNNNKFYKPAFNLNNPGAGTNDSIPVLFNCGAYNSIYDARCEGNGNIFVKVTGSTCSENFFEAGYSDQTNINIYSYFADTSASYSTEVKVDKLFLQQYPALVFKSGFLPQLVNLYDGTNYYVNGVGIAKSTDSLTHTSIPLSNVQPDYIELANVNGLSVYINTGTAKRFLIKRNVVSGNGGRIAFVAYDSAGNVLLPTAGTYVIAMANIAIYANATAFGGCYTTSSDGDSNGTFAVSSAVYKVKVIFTGGTATLQIRDFSIYSLDTKNAQAWSGLEPLNLNSSLVNALPTYIALKGTKVYNDFSVSANTIGWANVDGNTGWQPFGLVNLPNLMQTASIKTTNATPATIYTYAILINTVNQFTIDINGSDISGDVISQKFVVRVKRGASGAPALIGSATALITAYADTALSTAAVSASISGNNLILTVTGVAAIPIQWGALIMILSTQDVGS